MQVGCFTKTPFLACCCHIRATAVIFVNKLSISLARPALALMDLIIATAANRQVTSANFLVLKD